MVSASPKEILSGTNTGSVQGIHYVLGQQEE